MKNMPCVRCFRVDGRMNVIKTKKKKIESLNENIIKASQRLPDDKLNSAVPTKREEVFWPPKLVPNGKYLIFYDMCKKNFLVVFIRQRFHFNDEISFLFLLVFVSVFVVAKITDYGPLLEAQR